VHGSVGGYTSLIVVTDATRTDPEGSARSLITLAGIGHLQVSCTRRPRGRVVLTSFAKGEGPPTITKTVTPAHGRSFLPGYTRGALLSISGREAQHQQTETWLIEGGGEAFQFIATITDLLTATSTRCDLLAQATVVTHGPFYRYAHVSP
jgi:hypothetical protein